MSRYAATPLIAALSPGYSDITRFRPWSPIATGNHLNRAKNSKYCSDEWQPWRFWSAFRHFGTHFAGSFRVSKSSWMMDPTHSREIPSFSAIDLADIRRSFKISSWVWSIISGVVTVLGLPGRGATQVEKSPHGLIGISKYSAVVFLLCRTNTEVRHVLGNNTDSIFYHSGSLISVSYWTKWKAK